MNLRLFKTTLIILGALFLHGILSQGAYLVSNKLAVAQFENSDSAAYAVQTIGNGGRLVDIGLTLISIGLLYVVWRNKKEK